jgi:hypothetical protein
MSEIRRIPRVERLPLPEVIPHPKALASFNEREVNYDPELWEFEYTVFRYLGRLSDDALRQRYDSVIHNMQAIISDDRHVIPIKIFLSSWYWYRKEHLTRLEFALRELPLHRAVPTIQRRELDAAPARPRAPNSCDVLFRYGERYWLKRMIEFGDIRIRAARQFAEMEKDPARHDDELNKHRFSPGEYVSITLPNGQTTRPIGDMKTSVTGTDYFAYCVSNDWDPQLFANFKVDACVIIHDVDEFARRLNRAAASKLEGWYFHYNPIQYYDPYERLHNERIDHTMSKEFRFAYQRETRFLWAGLGRTAVGFIDLTIGSLADIATYVEHP